MLSQSSSNVNNSDDRDYGEYYPKLRNESEEYVITN